MPTFRPAIKADDGYLKKVVKYIPAEIIAAYTFCIGLITNNQVDLVNCSGRIKMFPWILYILLLFTPIYMYLSVIDNPAIIDPIKKKRQAIFHAAVSMIAYLTWVFALGDLPMVCYLKQVFKNFTYDSIISSLIMVGFCLLVPLLERFIIGNKP